MATYAELMDAARRADSAGATDDARRLLEMAVAARDAAPDVRPGPEAQLPAQPAAGSGGGNLRGMLAASGIDLASLGPQGDMPGGSSAYLTPEGMEDPSLRQPASAIEAGLIGLNQGATLGYGDEIAAGAQSLFPGQNYDDALAARRADMARAQEDRPWISMGGEVFGSMAPMLLAAPYAAPALAGGSLPVRMGAGAMLGAGEGAVSGFGKGEGGALNRLTRAGLEGAVGGAFGGAVPVAADMIGAGVSGLRNFARDRRVGGAIGDALGVAPETGRVLSQIAGADDADAVAQALARSGPGGMLADGSGRMSQTLDYVMQNPVPGADLARQRVNDRAGQSFYDVMGAIDPQFGPKQGVESAMDAIRTGTAGARSAAYDAAYATPINYAGRSAAPANALPSSGVNLPALAGAVADPDAGGRLLALQSRLPPQAINYANQLMRLKGEQSAQIMANIADDGAVTFTRLPDVRQWDYIKQALDQLAESGDGAGALGGQTRLGAAYQGLARDIRDNLAAAVPEYRTALDTAADAITRRQAVEFGSGILSPRTTTEEALSQIATATGAQRAAMQEGMRGQLREAFGNINTVPSDQAIDARQAAAALRQFTSPNAQIKLSALFGDEWPGMLQEIERAGVSLGLRADLATGSKTAGRQFARDAVEDATRPSALQQGRVVDAAQNLVGGLTGVSREAVERANARVQSELADVLTRQGGAPQEIMSAVAHALARNPALLTAGDATRRVVTGVGAALTPQISSGIAQALLGGGQ